MYLKLIKEKQAKAHVLPKQAKPIFLSNVRAIAIFIDRELKPDDLHVRERYVLFRDQAWLTLQFFTGDGASDFFLVVAQEVKCLADGSGLVFKYTFGKTLRGDKSKSNSFVIKKCLDLMVCPVKDLLDFAWFAKLHNVDLSTGYLVRIVAEYSRGLDKNVGYSVVYEMLKYYLSTLGIYEGKTPHSFRSGCVITMTLSGSVKRVDQVMNHVEWFGKYTAEYYCRISTLVDSGGVASKFAESLYQADVVERQFKKRQTIQV